MKNSAISVLITVLLATTSTTLAKPVSYVCKDYGKPGLLKLENYQTSQINGTVLAEGTLSVTTNESGNENLKVQFEKCNFKGYNYVQGSSRNSDGSMGAPLEYFGKIVQANSRKNCLTASSTDTSQPNIFRFRPCSKKDDDDRLQQLFAYQVGTGGTQVVYVGAKNTTDTPYKGGHYWTVGRKPSPAFPPALQATNQDAGYVLNLVSSDQ